MIGRPGQGAGLGGPDGRMSSLMLIVARRLAGTVWRALTNRQEPPL